MSQPDFGPQGHLPPSLAQSTFASTLPFSLQVKKHNFLKVAEFINEQKVRHASTSVPWTSSISANQLKQLVANKEAIITTFTFKLKKETKIVGFGMLIFKPSAEGVDSERFEELGIGQAPKQGARLLLITDENLRDIGHQKLILDHLLESAAAQGVQQVSTHYQKGELNQATENFFKARGFIDSDEAEYTRRFSVLPHHQTVEIKMALLTKPLTNK